MLNIRVAAVSLSVIAAALLSFNTQAAGDVAAGKAKSAMCSSCHGATGHSVNPLWPNLAGQHAAYLEKQLKDFRDGKRHDPVMTTFAKGLSDQDIANLSAFFAAQK